MPFLFPSPNKKFVALYYYARVKDKEQSHLLVLGEDGAVTDIEVD